MGRTEKVPIATLRMEILEAAVSSSNAARRYDDGCHVSRPLLLVACTFMAQDADVTTACSSAVSTHVGVL